MANTSTEQRRLAAIMFTDMVGYSALTQKNEQLALRLLNEHKRILRPILPKHDGKEIEAIGDAFFVEFESALEAVRCAIEIQDTLHNRNLNVTPESRIRLRIGLHLGDVVHSGKNVQGDGVNIAARLEPLAQAGGICISEDVERQVRNKIDIPLRKLGKGELKNIKLEVDVFRIVLPWEIKRLTSLERFKFALRQRQNRVRLSVLAVVSAALYFAVHLLPPLQPPEHIRSIAVLPFQHSVNVPEWRSDGLTQVLTNILSQLPYTKVISVYSVFRYKSKDVNIRDAGFDLGVDAILSGRMQRIANGLSVKAEFSDTQNGIVIWETELNDSLYNVMRFAKEIMLQLADRLDVPLGERVEQKLGTYYAKNNEAFDAYLHGLYEIRQGTKFSNGLAITYFKQALDRDSTFVAALNMLAYAQQIRYEQSWEDDRQLLALASANCIKVLRIDSTNADAMAILSVIETLLGNVSGGTGFAAQSLKNDPNNVIALTHLGVLHVYHLNDPAKGVTYFRKVQEIEPLYWAVYTNLGVAYAKMSNFVDAGPAFRRAVQLDSSQYGGWLNLGDFYEHEGMDDSALSCYERALRINSSDRHSYESFGHLLLARREFARVESLYVQGARRLPNNTSILYGLGLAYSFQGKSSLARNKFQEGLLVQQTRGSSPSDAEGYVTEGLFHARLGNVSKARELAAKAIALDSTSDEVMIKSMRIYAIAGEGRKVIESFKRAKDISPSDYDAMFLRTALDLEKYRTDPAMLAIAGRSVTPSK